ncbi:MAG: ISC system 2Fe-2S type ferredoxin [Candidatus Oxydemutatoraceae bacterium WSBS_2016_MAG_OTU14]
MPKITFLPHAEICPQEKTIEVESGISICDAALQNDIHIEHACEKSCACTTCHVHIRKGYNSLAEPTEIEEDFLDKAWGLDLDSRLSCQALVQKEDLVIEIPRYTINLASEGH